MKLPAIFRSVYLCRLSRDLNLKTAHFSLKALVLNRVGILTHSYYGVQSLAGSATTWSTSSALRVVCITGFPPALERRLWCVRNSSN
jgi:hypothetical protein